MNYIYRLDDPRDSMTRYVGRTKDIRQRLHGHVSFVSGNQEKTAWINELRDAGLSPLLTVLEEVEDNHAKEREAYWFYFYLDRGASLVNSMRGICPSFRRTKVLNG